jgi:spermidine/putrescine transport system permease protein
MKRYNYTVNALSTIIVVVVALVLILVNLIPRLTEKKANKEEE